MNAKFSLATSLFVSLACSCGARTGAAPQGGSLRDADAVVNSASDEEARGQMALTCQNKTIAKDSDPPVTTLRGRYVVTGLDAALRTIRVEGYGPGEQAARYSVALSRVPAANVPASEGPGPLWRGSFAADAAASNVLTVRLDPSGKRVAIDDRNADKGFLACQRSPAAPVPQAQAPEGDTQGPTGSEVGSQPETHAGSNPPKENSTRSATSNVEPIKGTPPKQPIVTQSGTGPQTTPTGSGTRENGTAVYTTTESTTDGKSTVR